jgi:hypothetical protein
MFPTADQIAQAVVAAARLQREDPIAAVRGAPGARCRAVAYEALRSAFADARRGGLARLVGFRDATSGAVAIASAKRCSWWSDDAVDEIVGMLLSDKEEGCPAEDPDRLGGDGDCHDACARPAPAPSLAVPPVHFDPAERKLIARMWRAGANEVSNGAALGSDADTIRIFLRANPALCPERTLP